MLPHILHSTTRAVAVVQNQTQALRNVLQLQSSGPSSGSGSSWGNGPGPGGAKYNAGSRFYAGYNSAGRAVTQANAVTSNDGTFSQSDDNEDFTIRRPIPVVSNTHRRPRMRSSSVSIGVAERTERGEKLGVLKTVQLHARGKNTFTPAETLASAKERLLSDSSVVAQPQSPPLLVRRNSTSAPLSPLLTESAPLPTEEQKAASRSKSPTPFTTSVESQPPVEDSFISRLRYLSRTSDEQGAIDTVRRMLTSIPKPTVDLINAGLDALTRTRSPGVPLTQVIGLYNTMLERSVVPNVQTYECLIQAMVSRDLEVRKAVMSLEMRIKRAPLVGRLEAATIEADQARIEKLKEEDNFPSAMSLFESVLAIGAKEQLSHNTFTNLLAACASHGDVNSAIHVFAQMESTKDMRIGFSAYQSMILAYSNAKQIKGAEAIFESFLTASKGGFIRTYPIEKIDYQRRAQIMVWNVMIEAYFRSGFPDKAIGLVDKMLNSKAGDQFGPEDVPIPTSSTFTTVIAGFILSGDLQSALAWFNNLLGQEQTPSNPFEGLGGKAMRPDSVAWHMMLDALAGGGQLDELNRLYTIYKSVAEQDNLQMRQADHVIIHRANIENLPNLDDATALETLQFLLEDLAEFEASQLAWNMKVDICKAFVSRGNYDIPSRIMTDSVIQELRVLGSSIPPHTLQWFQKISHEFIQHVYTTLASVDAELPFISALDLSRLTDVLGLKPELRHSPHFLHSYGRARSLSLIPFDELAAEDWNVILVYAASFEANALKGNPENLAVISNFGYGGLATLLDDMATHGVTFDIFPNDSQKKVVEVLGTLYGEKERDEFLARLGPTYIDAAKHFDQLKYAALEDALSHASDSGSASEIQTDTSQTLVESMSGKFRIDKYLSKSIDEAMRSTVGREKPTAKAFRLFEEGLKKGIYPQILTFAHLIEALGRQNELDKVRELYAGAQSALSLVYHKQQMSAWMKVEDAMIIALAHSGHVDAAHVHRLRILDQGGYPSADAYGVLIQHVKDTTDDASAGLVLFQEAIERGVRPNLYLYNNIISKLSKARKADHALELFQQMKASGIKPSSITYGAVIGACARVGDVLSADSLYNEMVQSPDFKPRVPPYNTMMQLYTTTKPNRNSVLHFRSEMLKAGVKPSAHTYKLLMDAYGSIEPVDIRAMERVFEDLQKDASIPITGAHFASLINAYGCVSKDLDKAISVFESIRSVPRAPAPDAVVFEAIINVIVAHKRTELIPVYVNKMNEAGVHMTAYIANFLIKGYANVNNMEQARAVFESLHDPPTGVAAPNNHAPHSPTSTPDVPVMEPVYREPSTWEVMVRAELGTGNRSAAIELLERLRERQYPEAVYNRISGVLTDHSMPL